MGRKRPAKHTVHTKHPRYRVEKFVRGRGAPVSVHFPNIGTQHIYPHATRQPDSTKYELYYSQQVEASDLISAIIKDDKFGRKFNTAVYIPRRGRTPKIRFNPKTAEWEIWIGK